MTGRVSYALGSSDLEHQRLMVQARFLRPWTDRFLRAGGLRPGMSVLDLGSGIGDVALLAAEMVGPTGHVTGIDRDDVITGKARLRVENEALTDVVSFEVANLDDYQPDGLVDAVIGRYVLLYQDDPAATLRRYAQFLRPGGVLIFHDIDTTNDRPSWPPCPAWDDYYRLITEAYLTTGAPPDFGRRLSKAFIDAGLPRPVVEAVTPIVNGPDSPVLDWIARSLLSLEPLIAQLGTAQVSRLDYEDLMARWREAIVGGVQIQAPAQYGAWARLP